MSKPRRIDVMISSTARDLPVHRQQAMDGILRQGMHPIMMEYLPAIDADAIKASLDLVDEGEIYLGIFAHRYGYVPKGYDISITEMEYNRAVERGIPRLIFIMHDDHPVKASDVETGDGAARLKAFKDRLQTERVVNYFKSPEDLRAEVLHGLQPYHESDVSALHYVSDIPKPPEAYIAHPYTLLQTRDVVGRQAEMNLLTDWVTNPRSDVYSARILNIVAMGGMGKSALTWKWFNEIAPQEIKPLAGRLWWSFYESDAHFENFVIRALAYVNRQLREEVQKIPPPERETQLLAILDREPYLFVLDGLERILLAYARMDAAHLADDDLDKQTANFVAGVLGLPESAADSFTGQHRLRLTADPRAGQFLRKLAAQRSARILVSTRLYPADLQLVTDAPRPGSFALFLTGLPDDDAVNLWRAFRVADGVTMTGTREELLRLFHTFDNYPLLIRALAGEVAHHHKAPGNFDAWRKANPDFNPFKLDIKNTRTHVLQFAVQGLDDKTCKALPTVAAFRMPATYDTLVALLVGDDKLLISEHDLDNLLTDLEDRGLLGWDRRANRYDLHPIVRGVVWNGLDGSVRQGVYTALHNHFETIPDKFSDYREVNSLDDLTPAIELYNTLVGLGRYDDAFVVFSDRISDATLYRLGVSRQRIDLLVMLFPDGLDHLPYLSRSDWQAYTFNTLALAYEYSGQPDSAVLLFRRHNVLREQEGDQNNLGAGLGNLSYALRFVGALYEAEAVARRALYMAYEQANRETETSALYWLGLVRAARGIAAGSEAALRRSLWLVTAQDDSLRKGMNNIFLGQRALWLDDSLTALPLANRAWKLLRAEPYEPGIIEAARLQGAAALALGKLDVADERLHLALARARAVSHVQEELPALVALAEMKRQQHDLDAAREYLDGVWELAERGPYPLLHADAFNVLAQIERDAGHREAAVKAATNAYRKAWCDGISADGQTCYAYWYGLQNAKRHLRDLGVPEPVLPPFDPSKFEPMIEVEIDPPDDADEAASDATNSGGESTK